MNITRYALRFIVLLAVAGGLSGFAKTGQAQVVQDWSEPVNLSKSGAASNPSLVVDGTGVVHIIWLDEFDGYKYAQSADGGITWSAPVAVKYPFSKDAPLPLMFGDAQNTIHIFWLTNQNKLSYARALATNLASPASWRIRNDLDSSVYDFDAAIDSQGRMQVAYVKNPAPTGGPAGVYYRRSADAGLSWLSPTLLYESSYFRSLSAENAHIRIAVSDQPEDERVYVVWDDRPQKRIFFTKSNDSGLNWDAVKEMVAPQANLSFGTPYYADIDVLGDKVLATWLVGDPGSRCTTFSWYSMDGGDTWGEQEIILPESSQCPEQSEFIDIEQGYSVLLFTIQANLTLSAWNGESWSDPEIQTGLHSITNPATFDPVVLGCKQAAAYNNRLYVVGCDEAGGDIWFMTRQLDPLENLFPVPSKWGGDTSVITITRPLAALASVSDASSNVHAVWIQSSNRLTDDFVPRLEYTRWDGAVWSQPVPIMTNLGGVPKKLAFQIDSLQRLLLSWVSPQTGELLFSWANSERANSPLEWTRPDSLTTFSSLNSSPEMLVDASDRIVIAFAVSLNENRGVYIIQSADQGQTWSEPTRVFDAVSEKWEMVDQPQLALTGDGSLHILFTRYTLLDGIHPIGLYYSRSNDGGMTWIPPETVSEQEIAWSDIVAYQNTVHRLWQEQNRSFATTNHQASPDNGLTWSPQAKLPHDTSIFAKPAVVTDSLGNLHLLQISEQNNQILQEWEWAEQRWQLVDSKKIAPLGSEPSIYIQSGITSNGMFYTLIPFEKPLNDQENGIETTVISIRRSLENTGSVQPFPASISTPSNTMIDTPSPDTPAIPTPTSVLAGLDDPQPRLNRNLIGLTLLVFILFFLLVFTLPRRNKATYEDRTLKK